MVLRQEEGAEPDAVGELAADGAGVVGILHGDQPVADAAEFGREIGEAEGALAPAEPDEALALGRRWMTEAPARCLKMASISQTQPMQLMPSIPRSARAIPLSPVRFAVLLKVLQPLAIEGLEDPRSDRRQGLPRPSVRKKRFQAALVEQLAHITAAMAAKRSPPPPADGRACRSVSQATSCWLVSGIGLAVKRWRWERSQASTPRAVSV